VTRYRTEILRLIAQIGMGTGALAVVGGTAVIISFVTLSAGSLVALQGFASLSQIGIQALLGFVAALINVRLVAPVVSGVVLAATVGAGGKGRMRRPAETGHPQNPNRRNHDDVETDDDEDDACCTRAGGHGAGLCRQCQCREHWGVVCPLGRRDHELRLRDVAAMQSRCQRHRLHLLAKARVDLSRCACSPEFPLRTLNLKKRAGGARPPLIVQSRPCSRPHDDVRRGLQV